MLATQWAKLNYFRLLKSIHFNNSDSIFVIQFIVLHKQLNPAKMKTKTALKAKVVLLEGN